MTATTTPRLGLRERKKQRTRQTIVDVAAHLFVKQGYNETTLVQIAEAAEISPSTFFNYFPSKVGIVFGLFDAVIESARERILERPEAEPATQAVVAWVRDELPVVEGPYVESMRDMPKIVAAVDELRSEERLRFALLEDVLAGAFARDFGESADGLHARVMAAIALRGMIDVWNARYAQHAGDADFDPTEVFKLKAEYLELALDAGLIAVASLPTPVLTQA